MCVVFYKDLDPKTVPTYNAASKSSKNYSLLCETVRTGETLHYKNSKNSEVSMTTHHRWPGSTTFFPTAVCFHDDDDDVCVCVTPSKFEMALNKQHANFKLCVLHQKSPSGTLTMLQNAYGNSSMKKSQMYD